MWRACRSRHGIRVRAPSSPAGNACGWASRWRRNPWFAFGPTRLGPYSFPEGAVAAAGRQEQVRAGSLGTFGVGGEGAADEFDLLIDRRRDAMHGANESAPAAAHHSVT